MDVIKIATKVTRINMLEKNAKFLYGTNQSLSNKGDCKLTQLYLPPKSYFQMKILII